MKAYILNTIIILFIIGGCSIFSTEKVSAQSSRLSERQSEEPFAIVAYKSVDDNFNLKLNIMLTNKQNVAITSIEFTVYIYPQQGLFFDELMYKMTFSDKWNCAAGETRSIKATCRPDDFTSLAMSPIDDEYKGYIEIKKIRYSNGKIWYSSKPKEYKLEWM